MTPDRLCHCCGRRAIGDICATILMQGKIARDIPICLPCSRDLFALEAFADRVRHPS